MLSQMPWLAATTIISPQFLFTSFQHSVVFYQFSYLRFYIHHWPHVMLYITYVMIYLIILLKQALSNALANGWWLFSWLTLINYWLLSTDYMETNYWVTGDWQSPHITPSSCCNYWLSNYWVVSFNLFSCLILLNYGLTNTVVYSQHLPTID